jgi:hypothetical protein
MGNNTIKTLWSCICVRIFLTTVSLRICEQFIHRVSSHSTRKSNVTEHPETSHLIHKASSPPISWESCGCFHGCGCG